MHRSSWLALVAALWVALATGCPRERPAAPRPAPPGTEMPADASMRLITDPLPAYDPTVDGSTPPSIPLGPR